MKVLERYRLRLMLFGGLVAMLVLVMLANAVSTGALRSARDELQLVQQSREWQSLISQLVIDAQRYVDTAPRNHADYDRDTATYWRRLREELMEIEARLDALELLHEEADQGSGVSLVPAEQQTLARALREARAAWRDFRAYQDERLGEDHAVPRLEWGAEATLARQALLLGVAGELTRASGALLNAHLDRAGAISRWGMLFSLVLTLLLGLLIGGRLQQRISGTLEACGELAAGRFGHQIPTHNVDEFTDLHASINRLSIRMALVLRMLDGLQRSRDRLSTLTALHESLRSVCDLCALGLYEGDADESRLHRCECRGDAPALAEDIDKPDRATTQQASAGGSILLLRLPDVGLRQQSLALVSPTALDEELVMLLRNLAPMLGSALQRSLLMEQLLLASISGLSRLAESRDPETGDHLLRMALYSQVVASELQRRAYPGVDAAFVRDLYRFAPMHDIGKVGIPDAILLKPGPLTAEERTTMNQHPLIGARVLRACAAQLPESERGMFEIAAQIAEGHHERFDGKGYPKGLSGNDIPLAARIVAVADVFDALTSKRPYKRAWSFEEGLAALRKDAGAHFDPEIVDAIHATSGEIGMIYLEHRHI